MIIGERLKEARKNKKYSQQELGNMLGVSKVSICGYEKGTRTPTMVNFLDLVKILDLDVKYVLGQDVRVVSDEEVEYKVRVATVDLEILKEIKSHRELYNKLCSELKKTVDLINKKL